MPFGYGALPLELDMRQTDLVDLLRMERRRLEQQNLSHQAEVLDKLLDSGEIRFNDTVGWLTKKYTDLTVGNAEDQVDAVYDLVASCKRLLN